MSDLQSLVWAHSLLALALKSTLILGFALVATLLLRKYSAALRHWIWAAALGSCLLLPLAQIVVPQWLPSSLRYTTMELVEDGMWQDPLAASVQSDALGETSEDSSASSEALGPHPAVVDMEQGHRTLWWMRIGAITWASVSAFLLLIFFVGLVRTRLLVKAGFPVVDDDWRRALNEAKERLGVQAYVRLLESKSTRVPIAAGFLRPSIVLPVNARDWSQGERVQVLVHELAHIRRRDNLTQAIAFVAASVLWFQPLMWLGLRRLKLLRELAADDAVLRSGERSEDYGDVLVRVARRARGLPVPSAAPMASKSGLVHRIEHLLGAHRRHPLSPRAAACCGFLLAASIAVVGSMGLNPTAAYALQSAINHPVSHERAPLFEPGIEGEARASYEEAMRLADESELRGSEAWSALDATYESWASAPAEVREFGAGDEARRIAELVVAGASHTRGTTGFDTVRRPSDLVQMSIIRLSNVVLARCYAEAERGETWQALKYLLALARYMDDRTRGNGYSALVVASSIKRSLMSQIEELAPRLSIEETREAMRAMEVLLATGPSWGNTVRSEAMWAVWIAPFSSESQIEELAVAMDQAKSAPELVELVKECPQALCEGGIMPRIIAHWATSRSTEVGVYVLFAARIYRSQRGEEAKRVEDLVPDVIPSLPMDPRTGKAYVLDGTR